MTIPDTVSGGAGRARADDIITVGVPGCSVDPSDVIGWWKGEGNSIAQIGPDLTGSVGSTQGVFGQGFGFDGADLDSTTGLPAVSTGVTISMWIKPAPAGTGRTQVLASRWAFPSTDDSARSYELLLDPDGTLEWTTDETSTRRPEELDYHAPELFDGYFHNVTATWDDNQFALYVNGNPAASMPSQGGVLNPAATTPFVLGGKSGFGDQLPFNGAIDEPAVIKRALTPAEVESLVGAGPYGLCATADTSGIVGPGLQIPG
ncbi:MAG TPA: LamG domain-containing protein, partial [Ilumatobacteraceae bacterium]